MASLPLACNFTLSPSFHKHPNKFVVPKSSKLSTSKSTLPILSSPCKPFSHETSSISPKLTTSTKTFATTDVAVETQTLTEEQWKIERKALSQQIESLEQKVEQLQNESSSANNQVDGILNDFYNISSRLQQLASSDDGLVHVDPNPSLGGTHPESIDEMVQNTFKYYDPAANIPPEEKLKYLEGNFGPVSMETPPTCDIVVEEGQIPETLNGMFLRNGPNPKFSPEASYMWMDGDSMIHGIRFKDGKATYVARYTQTSRLKQEEEWKKAQFIKFGDLVGDYGLFTSYVDILRTKLCLLDKRFGITTANVGLVYHAGRIMALDDFGEPYVLYVTKDGDLKTLGMNLYNGNLKHWLSPHPKIDPETGEMFNVGSLREPPYCIYRVISKEGAISDPVPITTQVPTYMHDVCITENYVIIQDLPLVYDPEKMKSIPGQWIFSYDETKKPRYGILPRYATCEDEIKWFEYDDSFFVFHNANAWEEDDDTVVLYCCNMEAVKNPITGKSSINPINFQTYDIGYMDFKIAIPQLFKMTFNMKTGACEKELINRKFYGDWPKINPRYTGRRSQYVYSGEVNSANKIPSIIKYDLKRKYGNPKRFMFPTDDFPHTYGTEVVFAPKTDSSTADEDDGYLINFVHREDSEDSLTGTSYVYVIDAKTMESVAKLRLPSRVPYGHHSLFVTEEQLQNQIPPSA